MAVSEYKPGDMPIEDHKKSYGGFLNASLWGAGLILVTLLVPILVFAAGFAWFPSLIATFVIGVIYGIVLKMPARWYGILILLAILGVLIGIIRALLG